MSVNARGRRSRFLIVLGTATALACSSPVDSIDPIDPVAFCGGVCWPQESWISAPSPAAMGWSESRLDDARAYSEETGSDAVMVIDRGLVVVDWGATARRHYVQSARKSFLSALYGMYPETRGDGLSLTMANLGIDDSPEPLSAMEKSATVEQLLEARSGVYHEAAAESQSMKDARPARGSHPPGSYWYYNNWDFNVAGDVFMQLTGVDLFQALYDRLAVPLGMQDFRVSDGFYLYDAVSQHPAYPFAMTARDMARLGLLMARNGFWKGVEVVPASWIDRSTRAYSDAGGSWNYGYMWWVAKPQDFDGHRMFAALGGSGHAIFIFPDDDLVVVHRVDADTYQHGWDEVYLLLRRILEARGSG